MTRIYIIHFITSARNLVHLQRTVTTQSSVYVMEGVAQAASLWVSEVEMPSQGNDSLDFTI